MKPISPNEMNVRKLEVIPECVIEAFNYLIALKWTGGYAKFKQDEVVDRILSKQPEGFNRQTIYDQHWLDVEDIYRAEGWKVTYDKPAYCESYAPTFEFSKP